MTIELIFYVSLAPPSKKLIGYFFTNVLSSTSGVCIENRVPCTLRCDNSLTKQINGARPGPKVTGCVQSVTLPSAGIPFPEDINTVLLQRSHAGVSLSQKNETLK